MGFSLSPILPSSLPPPLSFPARLYHTQWAFPLIGVAVETGGELTVCVPASASPSERGRLPWRIRTPPHNPPPRRRLSTHPAQTHTHPTSQSVRPALTQKTFGDGNVRPRSRHMREDRSEGRHRQNIPLISNTVSSTKPPYPKAITHPAPRRCIFNHGRQMQIYCNTE